MTQQTRVEELAMTVEKMSLANQLRLAAGLLEGGDAETAHILVKRVVDLLTLKKLFPARGAATP